MIKLKYIGETDEMTTKGKVYNIKSDGTFIDDTRTECSLGDNYKDYFEEVIKKSNSNKIQISVQCYPNNEIIKEVREYSKKRSIQAQKQNLPINISQTKKLS